MPATPALQEELRQARNSAFQFLKTRNRSEKEIRERLARKKYSKGALEETIRYLKNLELINDRQFAKSWISMRLNKPLGVRRIFVELLEKGISRPIVEEEIKNASENYPAQEKLKSLAQKRMARYQNLDPLKAKKRLFDFLLRRGFEVSVVKKVIEQL